MPPDLYYMAVDENYLQNSRPKHRFYVLIKYPGKLPEEYFHLVALDDHPLPATSRATFNIWALNSNISFLLALSRFTLLVESSVYQKRYSFSLQHPLGILNIFSQANSRTKTTSRCPHQRFQIIIRTQELRNLTISSYLPSKTDTKTFHIILQLSFVKRNEVEATIARISI